jgi:hypothetical protein
MTEWTWTLHRAHATEGGAICAVDWTLTGSQDGRASSRSGRAWLGAPGDPFVPLEDVTDDILLDWLSSRLAVDGVQAGILIDLHPLSEGGDVIPEPSIVVPDALSAMAIAGEAPGETKARLAGRWVELTHLLQMGLADADAAHEHTLLSAHQGWLTS